MKLHDLQPAEGTHKNRKRVGRGIAAGGGKTAGRGTKGQNSRKGGGVRPYFEGGQLPLVRRLPRLRGFKNIWRIEYVTVNLGQLNGFDPGSEISPETLAEAGVIKSQRKPVKVLGEGALDHPLAVKAHKFSASAREKILAAGGSIEQLTL
jgi:large subunit ribosomal protein L15